MPDYKRLETGAFTWPPVHDGAVTLNVAQLDLLYRSLGDNQSLSIEATSSRSHPVLEAPQWQPRRMTATQNVSGLTRDTTVTLSGTAADYPEGPGMARVYVGNYVGDWTEYPIGSTPVAADGTWFYTMSNLPDGTYNFLVTALDNQGYGVNTYFSPAVVIDTTGPTLTARESVSGTTGSRGIAFSGTVSDSGGVAAVEIYDTSGSTWTDLGSATFSSTTWQLTDGHLASGAHNFIAVAIDSLSNVSSASTGATVNVATAAPRGECGDDLRHNPDDHVTTGRSAGSDCRKSVHGL